MPSLWITFSAEFLTALVFSTGATWAVRRIALRAGAVASPREERWHRQPTPMMGGIAISGAFVATAAAFHPPLTTPLVAVLAGSIGMFFVGLIDDFKNLPPWAKFGAQLLLSVGILVFTRPIPVTRWAPVDYTFTVLWLVGITNAFNLLDNMNGLSGGVGAVAAVFRGILFIIEGQPTPASLCFIFAAAIIGFLFFNFPRGLIFMGDCGSLFIGFFLAATTLTGHFAYTKNYVAVLIFPVLLMLVPIFDTTLVTFTRRLSGRPVSVGGRDHVSHRLVSYGLTDTDAVLLLWAISAISGCVAFLFVFYDPGRLISVGMMLAFGLVLFGTYLLRFEQPSISRAGSPLRFSPPFQMALTAIFDMSLMAASYYTAVLLRFEGVLRPLDRQAFLFSLPTLILIKVAGMVLFGVYRTSWKYAGIEDALTIAKASAGSSALGVLYFAFVFQMSGVSRAALILDCVLFTLFAIGFRFSFRILDRLAPHHPDKRKILIFPADQNAVEVLRYLLDKRLYMPVGLLEEAENSTRWSTIHGVPVVGTATDLARIATETNAEAVLIACEFDGRQLPVVQICREQQLPVLRAEIRIVEVPAEHAQPEPVAADAAAGA